MGGVGCTFSSFHMPLVTSPAPSIWTHRIASLLLFDRQVVGSFGDNDRSWQIRNEIFSEFNVVPGGVNPNFVVITAMRTAFDAGVDSYCTIRRLSWSLPVSVLSE